MDYFLDPSQLGEDHEPVRTELMRLVEQVGNELRYNKKWANDEVRIFLGLLNDPGHLITRSKQQNIVLFSSNTLTVYAVLWE